VALRLRDRAKDQIAPAREENSHVMKTMKAVVVTHKFALDQIQEAFDLFSHQRNGVLKVALYPDATRVQGGREVVGGASANACGC